MNLGTRTTINFEISVSVENSINENYPWPILIDQALLKYGNNIEIVAYNMAR